MANQTLTSLKLPGLNDTYVNPIPAAVFDEDGIYYAGNYCTYLGQIYRCLENTGPGTFDSEAWLAVDVANDINTLIGALSTLTTTAKNNLVAAINEVASDSGWLDLALTANFDLYNIDEVKYRRVGKMVEVRGVIKPSSALTGSATVVPIGTLPAGYRPNLTRYYMCHSSYNCHWLLSIDSAGVVGFSRYGVSTTGTQADYMTADTSVWLPFNASFFVG